MTSSEYEKKIPIAPGQQEMCWMRAVVRMDIQMGMDIAMDIAANFAMDMDIDLAANLGDSAAVADIRIGSAAEGMDTVAGCIDPGSRHSALARFPKHPVATNSKYSFPAGAAM